MPFFWLILGAGIALMCVYGPRLARKPLKWWDWAWFAAAVLLFLVTFSFVIVSIEENEINAAVRGGVVFGLPTLILIVPLVRRWVKLG